MNYYIFAKHPGQRKLMALNMDHGQVGMLENATAFPSYEAAEERAKLTRAINKKSEIVVRSEMEAA